MNKKKFAVLALLMIVILTLTTCLLVACNPDSSDDGNDTKIEATQGLLINNSDFRVTDTESSTYPRKITSWTGAKMYSSSTFRDDVTAGAISLEKKLYDANKSKWGVSDDTLYNKLIEDGRYDAEADVNNMLMIYMPVESTNSSGSAIHGATAYGYTSTSFTLDKGSYYKLSVDVLTYNIDGAKDKDGNDVEGSAPGARIYVSSNTYAEFAGINTEGEWKTYEVYVETSPSSTTSLTLQLGLGKYTSYYTKGLTTGYAFFDNVVLEKVAETETATPEGIFNKAQADELDAAINNVATATLKVPNGHFDFGTTTISSSGTPSLWSLNIGNSGKEDAAPSSRGHNGIVDLTTFADNYTKYSSTYQLRADENSGNNEYIPAKEDLVAAKDIITQQTGKVGTNVFMLSQQLMTAQGIKSSRTITIEKNKVYALSVDLYTFGIHGAGVSLILTGSDGKDIVIKGISATAKDNDNVYIGQTIIDPDNKGYTVRSDLGNTTGGWKTYTFYIQGNQFKDYSYNMAIWLGTDGTGSNNVVTYHSYTSNSDATTYRANGTFANGWVFIDELTLTERDGELPTADANEGIWGVNDDQTLNVAEAGDNFTALVVDLTTENMFEEQGYILGDENASHRSTLDGVVEAVGEGAPNGWSTKFDTTDKSNPVIEGAISEGIVDLTSEEAFHTAAGDALTYPGLPYDLASKNAYMIHSSKNSYYEVETNEFDILANQAYRISLWVKTVDVKSASGAYIYLVDKSGEEDANLTSFTKINTNEYDAYLNDWCEVTMVVRGAADKNTKVALRFTLGTGNRWAASTLTSGSMFIANMNMSTLTYANFKDTSTGTYVKSVDLSESYNYTFNNGQFDDYDLDDENLEDGKELNEQAVAATPDDWTINDNTLNVNGKEDSTLFAGVIALTADENGYSSSEQAVGATGISENIFNHFYNGIELGTEDDIALCGDYANMLAIGSKDGTAYAAGFSSVSVTLSANTYYQLSVYVKTVGATTASVYLSGEASATGSNAFIIENNDVNGDWTKYTFYIEVGGASASIKLNLWLGRDVDHFSVEGESNDEKKENAKSAGAVFFDSVIYKEIDEDVYASVADGDTSQKITFLTDSFDSLSGTIESRSSLTTPNGWTGAVGTNQSSSNTKSGIIYADDSYINTEYVDGVEYVRILGKSYEASDIKVEQAEIDEAAASGEYGELEGDELVAAIRDKKLLETKKTNWIPVSELYTRQQKENSTTNSKRMLVINNTSKSAYTYTSTSKTFKENSFYKISVWVRTYGLIGEDGDETSGAYVELYLGSADESDNQFITKPINTYKPATEEGGEATNDWTLYEFYVKTGNDDVTSVTVKLSLGKYSSENVDGEDVAKGLTSGYAMFDDVTIEKIDMNDEGFAALEETDTLLKRALGDTTPGDSSNPGDGNTETNKGKFNIDYLWWMVPTIVIGLVIIVVVVVFIIRKLRKPAKKVIKKASAPQSSETIDRKRSKYDEGKE